MEPRPSQPTCDGARWEDEAYGGKPHLDGVRDISMHPDTAKDPSPWLASQGISREPRLDRLVQRERPAGEACGNDRAAHAATLPDFARTREEPSTGKSSATKGALSGG